MSNVAVNPNPTFWRAIRLSGLFGDTQIGRTGLQQRMGIASEQPTAVGLFAVDRDSITGELPRFPAGARGHRQGVAASRVGDFADDHKLLQFADALDSNLLVSGQEVSRELISAERRLARTEEHGIVRHQAKQLDQIAGVDGIDPG